MKVVIIFAIVGNIPFATSKKTTHYIDEDFMSYINYKHSTWTAGVNFPETTTMADLRRLVQSTPTCSDSDIFPVVDRNQNDFLIFLTPSFDARAKWSECISRVPKQGSSDTSWALAPVSVISDRLCIRTNQKKKFTLSPHDVITCCKKCQKVKDSGGWTSRVWDYWIENGIVTGGSDGCKPLSNSTTCESFCTNKNYSIPYERNKYHGATKYKMPKDYIQILIELAFYGPVAAEFRVYWDFFVYKEGVYRHLTGDLVGYHVVKIVGWGADTGTLYWLCENSWGTEWGDSGYFKILMGVDHCGIESNVLTGKDNINFLRQERFVDFNHTTSTGLKLVHNLTIFKCFMLVYFLFNICEYIIY